MPFKILFRGSIEVFLKAKSPVQMLLNKTMGYPPPPAIELHGKNISTAVQEKAQEVTCQLVTEMNSINTKQDKFYQFFTYISLKQNLSNLLQM